MASTTYCNMIRSKDHKYDMRLRLAKYAATHGIKPAMRAFGCARNTVREWLRRFREQGPAGLRERSRAPRSCPHKTPPAQEKAVLKARAQIPCAGPQCLKDLFDVETTRRRRRISIF